MVRTLESHKIAAWLIAKKKGGTWERMAENQQCVPYLNLIESKTLNRSRGSG
jgi:hypothetical protein